MKSGKGKTGGDSGFFMSGAFGSESELSGIGPYEKIRNAKNPGYG